jgi:hypothetical protein
MSDTTITPEVPVETPKAVLVAKEVLEQLGTLDLRYGVYLAGTVVKGRLTGDDLQNNIEYFKEECRMCALGACLLAKARLFDAVPLYAILTGSTYGAAQDKQNVSPTRETTFSLLQDVFSEEQLDMIESTFEKRMMSTRVARTAPPEQIQQLWDAAQFGHQFVGYHERVQAIMENIINNNGLFIPPHTDETMTDWELASLPSCVQRL